MEKPRAFVHFEDGSHMFGNLVVGRFALPLVIPAFVGMVIVFLSAVVGCSIDTFGGQSPNGVYLFLTVAAVYFGIWGVIGLYLGTVVCWNMIKEANDRRNR
ncbi:membrane protein [Microbacterium phage Zooman]|nr:membrane protein [Microbacterium phage Zooman]